MVPALKIRFSFTENKPRLILIQHLIIWSTVGQCRTGSFKMKGSQTSHPTSQHSPSDYCKRQNFVLSEVDTGPCYPSGMCDTALMRSNTKAKKSNTKFNIKLRIICFCRWKKENNTSTSNRLELKLHSEVDIWIIYLMSRFKYSKMLKRLTLEEIKGFNISIGNTNKSEQSILLVKQDSPGSKVLSLFNFWIQGVTYF